MTDLADHLASERKKRADRVEKVGKEVAESPDSLKNTAVSYLSSARKRAKASALSTSLCRQGQAQALLRLAGSLSGVPDSLSSRLRGELDGLRSEIASGLSEAAGLDRAIDVLAAYTSSERAKKLMLDRLRALCEETAAEWVEDLAAEETKSAEIREGVLV